ncbi:MAG: PEP-CTERM sorting domain-containing protein [Bryobacteraceae bacterium]
MKPLFLSLAILAAFSQSSFAAACVNGLLSSRTTCEITTGNGGSFQISNWSLTDPSLTGYVLSTSQFATAGAAEIFVSFATTSNSFAVSFSDNSSGTAGFNALQSTSVGNIDQQIQYKTGFFITPLSAGPLGTITTVGHAVNGITDNGVLRGSLTVQKIYQSNGLFDPTMTVLETTPAAANVSLTQANTTGGSNLSVLDVVTLSSRTGGSIQATSYTNTFTTGSITSGNEVPEPGTSLLMSIALLGFALLRNRR